MDKLFLLVCEGETDLITFEALALHLSTPSAKLSFTSLSPQQDATSGTYPPNGFGEVINWCKAKKNSIEMLIDFSGAAALFIQMDTDIAKQINENCILQGSLARQCCEEKLNDCLGVHKEPNRSYYILPTESTETWILASHDNVTWLDASLNEVINYELIDDSEKCLILLGYQSKKSGKKRKLNKNPAKKYHNYCVRLTNNLHIARQRCSELDRLCTLMARV